MLSQVKGRVHRWRKVIIAGVKLSQVEGGNHRWRALRAVITCGGELSLVEMGDCRWREEYPGMCKAAISGGGEQLSQVEGSNLWLIGAILGGEELS